MTTAEAAAVATATTPAATRFGHAGRGRDDDRRSECGFDCKCRDMHVCAHDLRKPRSINRGSRGSFRHAPRHRRAIEQFAATESSFERSPSIIGTTYLDISKANRGKSDGVWISQYTRRKFLRGEDKCHDFPIASNSQLKVL
jgi:hypothetical protein